MTGEGVRDLRVVVDGLGFTEGPRWRDGELWFSDFASRQVLSVTEDGQLTRRAFVVGQPSGLGFAPDGTPIAVSSLDRRLVALHPGGTPVGIADTSSIYGGHL